jgi:tRNA pseudouridine13 synthase
LTGAYRKVFVIAEKFEWRFIKHNSLDDSLILSDIEKLEGKAKPEDVADGKFNALILKFQLPSSVYATMLLREVMKVDTSVGEWKFDRIPFYIFFKFLIF